PTRSSLSATAPRGAGPAPLHCSLAPRHPRGQRSTPPPTTSSAPGRAPPLFGPGSLAHVAATAPSWPGVVPAAVATLGGRTRLPGGGATAQRAARFLRAPNAQ